MQTASNSELMTKRSPSILHPSIHPFALSQKSAGKVVKTMLHATVGCCVSLTAVHSGPSLSSARKPRLALVLHIRAELSGRRAAAGFGRLGRTEQREAVRIFGQLRHARVRSAALRHDGEARPRAAAVLATVHRHRVALPATATLSGGSGLGRAVWRRVPKA